MVDLENPDQLPVKEVFEDRVMIVSQILSQFFVSSHNLFDIHVFKVKESIADIHTELPCLVDFENPFQLPVQEVLRGTDNFVSWIFTISSIFMFSRSRNPFLVFLLSYHVQVTSKIKIEFRFKRFSKVFMILSYGFSQLLQYSCFRGQ